MQVNKIIVTRGERPRRKVYHVFVSLKVCFLKVEWMVFKKIRTIFNTTQAIKPICNLCFTNVLFFTNFNISVSFIFWLKTKICTE